MVYTGNTSFIRTKCFRGKPQLMGKCRITASKCLFDFGEGCSSPLRVLKQGSDQILHLRTRELHRQRTFTVSPPVERRHGLNQSHRCPLA